MSGLTDQKCANNTINFHVVFRAEVRRNAGADRLEDYANNDINGPGCFWSRLACVRVSAGFANMNSKASDDMFPWLLTSLVSLVYNISDTSSPALLLWT